MYDAVVIGVSAGGIDALRTVLSALPVFFPVPIAIVQHIAETPESYLAEYLNRSSAVNVREAEEKEPLLPATAYLAPPGYHLLIEPDRTFGLSADPRVNFSCPSVDVLFESAADVFSQRLIGVIMTGANADGSRGLKTIKARGGLSIVQNPKTAYAAYMPQAAINATGAPDYIVDLERIGPLLAELNPYTEGENHGTGTYT